VLAAPDASARRELLSSHHADLDRRLREIELAKRMIEHALHCPEQDFTRCMVFQEIVTGIAADTPAPDHDAVPATAGAAATLSPPRERLARRGARQA
jgi:MerR family transcriptional regulator, copper efflux regulator